MNATRMRGREGESMTREVVLGGFGSDRFGDDKGF